MMLIGAYTEPVIIFMIEMSLDIEMLPDIVVFPCIDLTDYWYRVARERIRSRANDIRSPAFFSTENFQEFLPRTRNSLFLIAKTLD